MLVKLWAGRFYGTNTGNLFAELNHSVDGVTGTIRLMDNLFGLSIYKVSGSFNEVLELRGDPVEASNRVHIGQLEISARLTPEGHLRGQWRSSVGTAGTMEAYPHDLPSPDQRTVPPSIIPEQIFTANISLGALRLYAKEVDEMIQSILRDFVVGRAVVTYTVRGNEVTKYFEDFKREAPGLGVMRRFKVSVQEPEAHGINRVIVIELNSMGQNEIRVQGINESWVMGKAEAIARTLRPYERTLVTTYKKFGLTLNQIIFLGMLVLIPTIESLWQRALFVSVVIGLLSFLFWLHGKYIPNVLILMGAKEPTVLQRGWPSILSWVSAATASLAAALLFYWLTRNSPP